MAIRFKAPVRIGVDIGGTFTDVVVLDAAGQVTPTKSLSDPADPARGVERALQASAAQLGCSVETLLGGCSLFVHGSTIATNTLLERKGARVGLLTTAGFRDSLEIRRCIRENVWDHRQPAPEVLVPRYLRLPVVGRIGSRGEILEPVDVASVDRAVDTFRAEDVGSVAICLLNSYVNAAHEREVRERVLARWPQAWVTCSAELAPAMGEYERSSTAVVNAFVAPRVLPYLKSLNDNLRRLGLAQDIQVVQSNGGCAAVAELAQRPVQMILSGPAAGISSIQHYARDIGNPQVIAIEVGGTSCDVTLADHANVAMVDELVVDGHHLAVAAVEIGTVGAGGGTIAGVDAGGLLYAGPEGAGSQPGPAAYGRGGERPTVTDAQLVLGRLRPSAYGEGGLKLDYDLAERAIRTRVAEPLGIGVTDAAAGILRLVEQNMRHAVEQSSVERGYNPQRFTLVAAGGAGPLHGTAVARSLGCASVYVPRLAGVFCAFGMCHAKVRHDYQHPLLVELDADGTPGQIASITGELTAEAATVLAREGFAGERVQFRPSLDLRYAGQQWNIRIETDSTDPAEIRRLFNAEHDRLYGSVQERARIEVVQVRLAGFGLNEDSALRSVETPARVAQPSGERDVWVDERTGIRRVSVYDGRAMEPGHTLIGPALIEEITTTVFVGAGDRLRVTSAGNYIIELAGKRQEVQA